MSQLSERGRSLLVPALATVAAVNYIGAELAWNRNGKGTTKLEELLYIGPRTDTIGVVFPGLGNTGDAGEKLAIQMAEATHGQMPWAHFKYGNSGLTLKDLSESLQKFKTKTGAKKMVTLAPSAGLITALLVARETETPFDAVAGYAPLSGIEDGYAHRLGPIAEKIPNLGLFGKAAGTLIADSVRPGEKKLGQILKHVAKQTLEGGSQIVFRDHFGLIKDFNPERDWKSFENVFEPGNTRAIFFSPPENADTTLRVGQSFRRLERFFRRNGVTLDKEIIENAGHADTEKAIGPFKTWLHKISAERGTTIFSKGDR